MLANSYTIQINKNYTLPHMNWQKIIQTKTIIKCKILSVKQQRIISEITSEFQRINKEKESQIKGSLIDINGLLKQQTDDLRLRKEIEAENKLKMQKMYDIVEADMDRLNKDLVHLGLICFYTYRKHSK